MYRSALKGLFFSCGKIALVVQIFSRKHNIPQIRKQSPKIIFVAVRCLKIIHHDFNSVDFAQLGHTFPLPHNATWGSTQIKAPRNESYPNSVVNGLA